jgi:group II intron reverse transcriptase/maturase
MSERPRSERPRRLADWLNSTGQRKVHSLIDKVYQRRNLELAWTKVKQNGGAGGVDGQNLTDFEAVLDAQLERLHQELRSDTYQPLPVRRHLIPKAGQPGQFRPLGIPAIYDRVCQQALLNRLEAIFEPVFDDASFGYRQGRSTKDALRKVWQELHTGAEWIVDGDLKDFFGSADQDKLITLVAQRVADGRVLRLLRSMLQAGVIVAGQRQPTEQGVPQGGNLSPLLSNILLTPFDQEMRRRGYRLTRYADDWVVTCQTRAEAERALAEATVLLQTLGVAINPAKTRIVHVRNGFEFLGYKIKRGSRPLRLAPSQIRSGVHTGGLYAYPRSKSLRHFKEQIRQRTRRQAPVTTAELIRQLNPVIRGWGLYYCKAHVRKLFAQLDRWILRRLWSQRFQRWRCRGWQQLPERHLYRGLGLVRLIGLIPSIRLRE